VVQGATRITDAPFRETVAVSEGNFKKGEAGGTNDRCPQADRRHH
jgi:hypothetical protein